MDKSNKELRNAITRSGLKYWEIAKEIGISASTFSVWLRFEIDDTKRKAIEVAIKNLEAKRGY